MERKLAFWSTAMSARCCCLPVMKEHGMMSDDDERGYKMQCVDPLFWSPFNFVSSGISCNRQTVTAFFS